MAGLRIALAEPESTLTKLPDRCIVAGIGNTGVYYHGNLNGREHTGGCQEWEL